MSLNRDSANGGFVSMFLYISCSLSSLRFSILHMVAASGLRRVVCDGFVGCCVSSKDRVGWISRSELMGVVENVRFGDLHPPIVKEFSGSKLLLDVFGGCHRCLYAARAPGSLSRSFIV